MLRVVLFSIVLTLAEGPSAALLCDVWCHSNEHRSNACGHQAETALARVVAHCNVSGDAIVFVRDDVRRSTAALDIEHAALMPEIGFPPSPVSARSACEHGSRPLLESRPVILSLRI